MKTLKFGNIRVAYTEKEDGNQRLKENREKVQKKLGIGEILISNQKHTNIVTTPENISIQSDGIYTNTKNLPVGVLTADCVPVVLYNQKEIAVIHAGWRGAVSGILESGIDHFEYEVEGAFIGPSIRNCCYEVQDDFIENLKKMNKFDEKFIFNKNEKKFFDLQYFIESVLKKYGIKNIYDISLCTKCDENLFSYRKGDFNERILTIGWIED